MRMNKYVDSSAQLPFSSLQDYHMFSYVVIYSQGLMHLPGRPVAGFDPEGLIFAAGINSEQIKLYDLRSFDKVSGNSNI